MDNIRLTEHVLERKGCPLHYWVGGPEGQPLVVLTHGACVDHHSFDQHIPVIAQRYRVITWDVRGHGQSQPMGQALTIPLAVEDLLAILDQMGYDRAIFVGHSNGSYIGQELAFRDPERVQALAVVDGTCITWQHSAFEKWLVHISLPLMALFPYETLKKSGLESISANRAVQDYTYAAYSQSTKENFLTIWKGVTECLHSEPGYRITQPLLLMHGAEDRMGNITKIAPLWATREPNCQYVVIPHARHFAILDDPEFFASVLMDWLENQVMRQ